MIVTCDKHIIYFVFKGVSHPSASRASNLKILSLKWMIVRKKDSEYSYIMLNIICTPTPVCFSVGINNYKISDVE